MPGRVLAAALGERSGAASLVQKLARESQLEADIVLCNAESLPGGTWAQATVAGRVDEYQIVSLLADACTHTAYRAIVIDGGKAGREAGARLALRRGLPVVSEGVALRLATDALQVTRIADGGSRTAIMVSAAPSTVVVASESIGDSATGPGRAREMNRLEPAPRQPLFDLIRESQLGPGEIDLLEADVVVAGGRGMGGPAGFAMLEDLAQVLGGTVGASRVAVDAGWAPYARQVGLTGKTVSPRLYIACGISGAPHHVLGMRDSSLIVAINSDAQAPIFKIAHVAVVGDAHTIVPDLITSLREGARGTAPALAAAR